MIVIPSIVFDLKGWSSVRVRYTGGRSSGGLRDRRAIFHGWWQHTDNIVRTLVANASLDPSDSPEDFDLFN